MLGVGFWGMDLIIALGTCEGDIIVWRTLFLIMENSLEETENRGIHQYSCRSDFYVVARSWTLWTGRFLPILEPKIVIVITSH